MIIWVGLNRPVSVGETVIVIKSISPSLVQMRLLILLFTFYWLGLCHMTTPHCKGGWKLESMKPSHRVLPVLFCWLDAYGDFRIHMLEMVMETRGKEDRSLDHCWRRASL